MDIILILIVIISLLLNALLSFIIRNLIIQNSKYESWVVHFTEKIHNTWLEMKRLDEKNIFERDDEVGVVFQQIKDTILDLNEKTQKYTDEEVEEIKSND